MQLWNDYEGATLAGQWTLGRLLRTEGRSALFATTAPGGKPAILRLTEALNDQSALQLRYKSIQAAGEQFLVRVQGFGDAELDSTPLAYAVLEPTEESLADILRVRRLDLSETLEVGQVVAGGLLALHAQGLIHGLVEPESVLAAGQQIKLRSDCARPAPEGGEDLPEDAPTAQTDAWGLANIIHQSLTQARLQGTSDALALPEPYAAIVRNTARGQWGVPEIAAELARHARAAGSPVLLPAALPAGARKAPAQAPPAEAAVRDAAPAPAAKIAPVEAAPPRPVSEAAPTPDAQPFSARAGVERKTDEVAPALQARPLSRYLLLGLGLLVVLLVLFFALHHTSGKGSAGPPPPAQSTSVEPAATAPPPPAEKLNPSTQTGGTSPSTATASGERDIWRVVAYTFNRRRDADRKASDINRKHPNFKADVWSRNGQRPFLVTLGGPLPHDQAMEMRALARQSGVAPDVYAQNYAH